MADCKDEHVIAAAQHIVKALGSNKNLTDEVKKILEELGSRLSTMTLLSENKRGEINEIEKRLDSVQEKIASWESDQSIWDSSPGEASEYLQAVEEVRRLTESVEALSLDENEAVKLLNRAHSVLQMGMAKLEEEFSHILVQNSQPFEPEHKPFRCCEVDFVDVESTVSVEDDLDDSLRRDSTSRGLEEFIIDLVHPDVIPDLKGIASSMVASKYDQECFQAYISIRKDAVDEGLFILEVEKLSIEDVLRMEWSSLNCMIKKWIRAVKIFVRVYLASEKNLCDQILGEFASVSSVCFVEVSKGSMLQLLNFGDAIAIGPRQPEKLFRILDMYEVLAELLPDIETLFSDEAGSSVRIECHEVLRRLGDSVRGTFLEFENAIELNTSTIPFAGGGIHPLTNYVMNYIKVLTDYSDTLNHLLEKHDLYPASALSNTYPVIEEENENKCSSSCTSLMAHYLRSITSVLESNLDGKSRLYRDESLQHFFLMNNVCYMVQKVKGSELGALLGDNWIRQHNRKFQKHAMSYERATWSSILSLLKDEGICNPGSKSVSKILLKERFRNFNLAFEEVYKSQTGWLISDPQLREDLRISVSLKVIQAYRTYMGRHASQLDGGRQIDRYIKYNADDLQNFLLDLFEGSPKSLHRRSWLYAKTSAALVPPFTLLPSLHCEVLSIPHHLHTPGAVEDKQ
ncbi:exocyst complex component EXO70E2-like isoform X2 [Macadamia integrifolia]|uniref:exocyst complex component EXO70E2-like isoform X2 n=1 Tax=Macadamia integrifolia TaxID=60698 RepID=UPI001C4F0186|nr:exocyst complex component EXO70E2-like isoform X2 [Macadamia integrifolia]